MVTIPNAPLVEAIFELRWGNPDSEDPIKITFKPDETSFFVGQFKATASGKDFGHVERVNPLPVPFPHIVLHRFRKAPDIWPCYQIGLGIFTANQTNDNYDWKPFKNTIMEGLDVLDKSLPDGLSNMNPLVVELKYIDAYLYDNDINPMEYLKETFNINLLNLFDKSFLKKDLFVDKSDKGINLSFQLDTLDPKGKFIFNLGLGTSNAKPAFIVNIRHRSSDDDIIQKGTAFKKYISKWLEKSHDLQKHAFKTLVNRGHVK